MASAHDITYQTGIYTKQGGGELHIGNPQLSPDGTGGAVVQGPNSQVEDLEFTFSPATGAANHTVVTIQAKDGLGNNAAGVYNVDLWLSDASTGAGLTATVPSVGVTATTGVFIGTYTTNKAFRAQTDATGKLVIDIGDAGKTLYFIAMTNGWNLTKVAAQLVTGNYG